MFITSLSESLNTSLLEYDPSKIGSVNFRPAPALVRRIGWYSIFGVYTPHFLYIYVCTSWYSGTGIECLMRLNPRLHTLERANY